MEISREPTVIMIANAAELFHKWMGLAGPLSKAQRKHSATSHTLPLARAMLILVPLQFSPEAQPTQMQLSRRHHPFISLKLLEPFKPVG